MERYSFRHKHFDAVMIIVAISELSAWSYLASMVGTATPYWTRYYREEDPNQETPTND